MSERGSFVTQYFYCEKCFEATKNAMEQNGNVEHVTVINSRILSGKIGGLWSGEKLFTMNTQIIPDLQYEVCCPVTIGVIPDAAPETFFVIQPKSMDLKPKPPEVLPQKSVDETIQKIREYKSTLGHGISLKFSGPYQARMRIRSEIQMETARNLKLSGSWHSIELPYQYSDAMDKVGILYGSRDYGSINEYLFENVIVYVPNPKIVPRVE